MGYQSQDEKDAMMDSLFDVKVKGKVDSIWRLQRQLERTNILLATGDVDSFEHSVLALKGDLPMGVKQAVLARAKEYNNSASDWKYQSTCGHNVGTPSNPLVIVAGHDEWNFLNEVPTQFQDKYPEKISRVSPIQDEYQKTDYIELFEVMKEELEKAGTTWQYERKTFKSRRIHEPLPNYVISHIVKNRVELLTYLRQMYPKMELGYTDLNCGWKQTPPTPILEDDKE